MQLVKVLLLVALVVAREVPLALVLRVRVYSQRNQRRLFVRVLHTSIIETPGESVLVGGAGMVGYFEFRCVRGDVVVDVYITPTIELVVLWFGRRIGEVVVHVCEAEAPC